MKLFLATALAALTVAAAVPANAGIYYQTATPGVTTGGSYTAFGDTTPGDTGSVFNSNSNFVGAAFAVTGSPLSLSGVGATFDGNGGGTDFVAVVPLASFFAFPTATPANLASIAIANAVFTAPTTEGDAVIPIAAVLPPGDYAVIFGSGLYGTTGSLGLADGNNTVGSPNIFANFLGDTYANYGFDTGIRIFEVPEPGTFAMLGLGGIVVSRLRRRRAA